jgi:hypothetical protein
VVVLANGAWHQPAEPNLDEVPPGVIALDSEIPVWPGGADTLAAIPVEAEA